MGEEFHHSCLAPESLTVPAAGDHICHCVLWFYHRVDIDPRKCLLQDCLWFIRNAPPSPSSKPLKQISISHRSAWLSGVQAGFGFQLQHVLVV